MDTKVLAKTPVFSSLKQPRQLTFLLGKTFQEFTYSKVDDKLSTVFLLHKFFFSKN